MMLLSCLTSWSQKIGNITPLRGDSCNVSIDIIRLANAKLIDRKRLIEVTAQKDSIIYLDSLYILEQSKIIDDFQDKVNEANRINEEVTRRLHKQRNITYGIAGATAVFIVTSLILAFTK